SGSCRPSDGPEKSGDWRHRCRLPGSQESLTTESRVSKPVRTIRTIRRILFRDQVHDPPGSGWGVAGAELRPFLFQSGTCPQNSRYSKNSEPVEFLIGCKASRSVLRPLRLLSATYPQNSQNSQNSEPRPFLRIVRILRTHLQGDSSTPIRSSPGSRVAPIVAC